jgi:hypothetical protein
MEEVAFCFGTTIETVFKERNTFFAFLACGVSGGVDERTRRRWLWLLFALGAHCSQTQASKIWQTYHCSLQPYLHLSAPLRSVYLTQPGALRFLLLLPKPPPASTGELQRWSDHLTATYCLQTRRLARLYTLPWNPHVFLADEKRTRQTALAVFLCCKRRKFPPSICFTLCRYLGLVRLHNRQ